MLEPYYLKKKTTGSIRFKKKKNVFETRFRVPIALICLQEQLTKLLYMVDCLIKLSLLLKTIPGDGCGEYIMDLHSAFE